MEISEAFVPVTAQIASRRGDARDNPGQPHHTRRDNLPVRRDESGPQARLPVDAILQGELLQRRPGFMPGELFPPRSHSTLGAGESFRTGGHPSPTTGPSRGIDAYRALQTLDPTQGSPIGDYVDTFV